MNIIQKIFGTHSQNELKRVYPIADAVMACLLYTSPSPRD